MIGIWLFSVSRRDVDKRTRFPQSNFQSAKSKCHQRKTSAPIRDGKSKLLNIIFTTLNHIVLRLMCLNTEGLDLTATRVYALILFLKLTINNRLYLTVQFLLNTCTNWSKIETIATDAPWLFNIIMHTRR